MGRTAFPLIGIIVVVAAIGAGIVYLGQAVHPQAQTVEKVIPDGNMPR